MGYYDDDGFYFHEEADLADPGAGFSELLNKPTQAMPAAVRSRVVEELAAHPTLVDAAEELIDDALASILALSKCMHLDAGVWVWDGPNGALATHYILPDHTGALVARATPFPTPSASTPGLDW